MECITVVKLGSDQHMRDQGRILLTQEGTQLTNQSVLPWLPPDPPGAADADLGALPKLQTDALGEAHNAV